MHGTQLHHGNGTFKINNVVQYVNKHLNHHVLDVKFQEMIVYLSKDNADIIFIYIAY